MATIKLGVSGTHSTGKTTLIRELEVRLVDAGLRVGRVADLAIDARNHGFQILHEHTFESTLWILSRGIAAELEAAQVADVVLVDRPVVDALGYLTAALAHRQTSLDVDEMDYITDMVKHHVKTYAIICKTVLNQEIAIGPGRDPDMHFRTIVARDIDNIYKQFAIVPRIVSANQSFIDDLVSEIVAMRSRS